MSDLLTEPQDATPLTDEEHTGLRLPVLTRAELNQVEAENISEAMTWLFLSDRRLRPESIIREDWLRRLHWRMYSKVWAWAGEYRTSDSNLGIPFWQVRPEMRNLEGDAGFWIANVRQAADRDEVAVRFGHRLVVIHPFPNGNGRWSRLAADALIVGMGRPRFTWGGASLIEVSAMRRNYITALQVADRDVDYGPLLAFARS